MGLDERGMSEHAARIRQLSDEAILRQDEQHTRARLAQVGVKAAQSPGAAGTLEEIGARLIRKEARKFKS